MTEDAIVRIEADTSQFEGALRNLGDLADRFGGQLTSALKSAVVGGRTLDDVLKRIGLNLAGMALEQGLAPLQGLMSSLLRGLMGRILPFEKGGIVPFASGGVVSTPTYFPMGGATGLMGEAGAEAIMPLRRGADGRLGVAGQGGARQGRGKLPRRHRPEIAWRKPQPAHPECHRLVPGEGGRAAVCGF